MATSKKKSTTETVTAKPAVETPAVFYKEQVLTFKRYANRRDLLSVLLKDGKAYTTDQIDNLIENFMKGKVK